ncbi:MAG TPA: GNAT family N-acetyltransferase, partial [Caulobacteraceae bacterium]|nr:GNAT family N-acetyltransferase [Caulobacteraceae bacterium]
MAASHVDAGAAPASAFDDRTGFRSDAAAPPVALGDVSVVSRAELAGCGHWASAFAAFRKDRRYYELIEDTLSQGFEHAYFVIRDTHGAVRAVQPFIVLDQDVLEGVGRRARRLAAAVRRVWPRFLKLRTLMVGCGAGEGQLDGAPGLHGANARALAAAIVGHARALEAPLVVLKEFPTHYRAPLSAFLAHGFARVPSMPMTRLGIDYADFDDYMRRALNSSTRRKLRKKFAAAAASQPIEMSEVSDAAPIVEELYPLYLQVYDRSQLHFEKLTPAFFAEIGRRMPDKARFFVWRQQGRAVAFALCMFEGEAFYPEYVGFDYAVALELHLYHYVVRDMISWAIAHGFKELRSSGLNYDPKLHFRHRLDPVDLYVRH